MGRRPPHLILVSLAGVVAAALALTACGEQKIEVPKRSAQGAPSVEYQGAQLFAERCAGCHTLTPAAAEGGTDNVHDLERVDGPSFDQRPQDVSQVLYAIRNGGFSGAIMPQNIVVGQQAQAVAVFLAKYSGKKAERPVGPEGAPPGF